MLYCAGTCGDKWLDVLKGCQQKDADAYCKLKMCDSSAIATGFDVKIAMNGPGFTCNKGDNLGDFFGMNNIYYDEDILGSHGAGETVQNVICSKGNSHFSLIFYHISTFICNVNINTCDEGKLYTFSLFHLTPTNIDAQTLKLTTQKFHPVSNQLG